MGIVGIFLGVFGDRGARGAGGEGCFGIGVMAHAFKALQVVLMEQHFRFIHCFRCCSSLHGVGNLIKWPQLNLIIPQLKSQSFRHSLSIKTNSIPTQSLEMPRSDLPMSRDQQLLSYLSLLRYGSDDPLHKGPRYLSYKAISHLTGVKAGTIFHLLKQYR